MPDRPLLVTSDADLLDDLLRLCAAAGVEASVAVDLVAARVSWEAAPVVVLGDELSLAALAAGLPRRGDLLLVGRGRDDASAWDRAAALGAESVAWLPMTQAWLVERLGAAWVHPTGATPVICVVGGRGGAGASTLACALALTAATPAGGGLRTLLVDADPLGGGLDLVLGAEDRPGLRWPELAAGTGAQLSASALSSALPQVSGLHLLSWDRGERRDVAAATARSVLVAAGSSYQLVVVDLPRDPGPVAEVALAAARLVLLVVPAEVRAVAAAARVAAQVGVLAREVRVVTRGPAPSGLTGSAVAGTLRLPLAGRLRPEPGLVRGLERGEPPGRSGRGPLADLCRSLLGELAAPHRRAA